MSSQIWQKEDLKETFFGLQELLDVISFGSLDASLLEDAVIIERTIKDLQDYGDRRDTLDIEKWMYVNDFILEMLPSDRHLGSSEQQRRLSRHFQKPEDMRLNLRRLAADIELARRIRGHG